MPSEQALVSLISLVYTASVLTTAVAPMHLLGLAAKSPKNGDESTFLDQVLKKHEIVPQVVNKTPKYICEVEYGAEKINFGNNLTEAEIEEKPTLVKWPAQKKAFYTLLMIGSDVPTRMKNCEMMWRHWVVGNIPQCDIEKGDTLVEYENTEPFYKAGFHRVIFLIYKQPGAERLNFKSKKGVIKKGAKWEIRGVWYIENFISKYNLSDPIAVNFFFLYNLNPHPDITTANPLFL